MYEHVSLYRSKPSSTVSVSVHLGPFGVQMRLNMCFDRCESILRCIEIGKISINICTETNKKQTWKDSKNARSRINATINSICWTFKNKEDNAKLAFLAIWWLSCKLYIIHSEHICEFHCLDRAPNRHTSVQILAFIQDYYGDLQLGSCPCSVLCRRLVSATNIFN